MRNSFLISCLSPALQYPVLLQSGAFLFFFSLLVDFHLSLWLSLGLHFPLCPASVSTSNKGMSGNTQTSPDYVGVFGLTWQAHGIPNVLRHCCALWVPDIGACGRHSFQPEGMHVAHGSKPASLLISLRECEHFARIEFLFCSRIPKIIVSHPSQVYINTILVSLSRIPKKCGAAVKRNSTLAWYWIMEQRVKFTFFWPHGGFFCSSKKRNQICEWTWVNLPETAGWSYVERLSSIHVCISLVNCTGNSLCKYPDS